MPNLRVLDISSNKVEGLDNLEGCPHMTDLWMNDNRLQSLDEVDKLRVPGGSLEVVYLHGNPLAKDPKYKLTLLSLCPKLEQLDQNDVVR